MNTLRGRLYFDHERDEWFIEDEKRGTVQITEIVQELAALEEDKVVKYEDEVDEGYVEITLGFRQIAESERYEGDGE